MECNEDETTRCKGIGEKKLAENNLFGARKFVLRARQLYPSLGFVNPLLAVIDVRIAAKGIVGINEPEPDYYGILQVDPSADDSTIKKEYHKLALLLHPDKNNSQGAEVAFKLLEEAYEVLSNQEKRFQHDLKRTERVRANKPPKSPLWRPLPQMPPQASPATASAAGAQAPQLKSGPFTDKPPAQARTPKPARTRPASQSSHRVPQPTDSAAGAQAFQQISPPIQSRYRSRNPGTSARPLKPARERRVASRLPHQASPPRNPVAGADGPHYNYALFPCEYQDPSTHAPPLNFGLEHCASPQSPHQASPPSSAAARAQASQQNVSPFGGMYPYPPAYARPSTPPDASIEGFLPDFTPNSAPNSSPTHESRYPQEYAPGYTGGYTAAHRAGYTSDYEPPNAQYRNEYAHSRRSQDLQSSCWNDGGNMPSSHESSGGNAHNSYGSNGGNSQSSSGSPGGNIWCSGDNVFSWYGRFGEDVWSSGENVSNCYGRFREKASSWDGKFGVDGWSSAEKVYSRK